LISGQVLLEKKYLMHNKAILNILELKLNSYSSHVRDLQAEVVKLKNLLTEKEIELIKAKEQPKLTKNTS